MPAILTTLAAWLLALPATLYALHYQRRILKSGTPLFGRTLEDARLAGVADPLRVRVLLVDRIPNPLRAPFSWLERRSGVCVGGAAGLTLGHGIFILRRCEHHRALLLHELAHVAQYERLGGIRRFLCVYLRECMVNGYADAPLEVEARRVESHATHP